MLHFPAEDKFVQDRLLCLLLAYGAMPLTRCALHFAGEIKTISQQALAGRRVFGSHQETNEEEKEMTGDKIPGASANLSALSDLCTPWCIHVVATLRIAERLAAGTTDIKILAQETGCDADSLQRVLRHLVSKGVFQEPTPDRFVLNEAAQGLLNPALKLGLDLDGIGGLP